MPAGTEVDEDELVALRDDDAVTRVQVRTP